jgi:Cu/Ag efflux pump CusA
VSLVASIVVLYVLGASANVISVAGIVLGALVVVDDAVTATEAIIGRSRRPEASDTGRSVRWIIVESVATTRAAGIYTWLIVALALVPLLLLSGVAGSFLPPMLVAYAAASLLGLLVAITLTPALAALLLSEAQQPRRVFVAARRLAGSYRSALAAALSRSRVILAGSVLATVAVVAATGALIASPSDRGFVPELKERDLLIDVQAAPGTSAEELQRIAARAGAELRAIPGVRGVGGHVGRAVTSDQVVGTDAGVIWVTIDRGADPAATRRAIEAVVAGYPGIGLRTATYTNDRIDAVLDPPQRDVVVRVYGQEQRVLRQKADEVAASLAGIQGLGDVSVDAAVEQPTLEIEVDLPAAERLGLKPGDIRRTTTTLLSGLEVGLIFEEQKVFQVVVWGTPEIRASLDAIRDLPIQTASGAYVPLSQVAHVNVAPSPSVVRREGVFRYVDIGGTVSGRDLGAVLNDVHGAVAGVVFPFEYRAEVVGSAAERQALLYRLLAVIAGVVVGILLLFQAAFSSWRRAAGVLLTLPAALLGAVAVAWLLGGTVTIAVIGGLIAVLAFAVRHGILVVEASHRLERARAAAFDDELILDGAEARFTPLLSNAAVLAMIAAPFALLGGEAGLEVVRPMALVLLGGLVTTTLVALFVLPVVILRTGPSPEPESEGQPLVEQPGLSPA